MGRISVHQWRSSRLAVLTAAATIVLAVAPWPTEASPARQCRPPTVTSIDIGTLAGGVTFAGDMNDRGTIVGTSVTPDGTHAFRWHRGVMTDLTPGLTGSSSAHRINDRGQILMDWHDQATGVGGVGLWWRGRVTEIPRAGLGGAVALNERGQVLFHGGLWDDGTVEPIVAPPGLFAQPYGLGDGGHVYGALYSDHGGPRPTPHSNFMWHDGSLTEIVLQSAPYGFITAADRSGRLLINTPSQALVWDAGDVVELPGLGGGTGAYGINQHGQIVGASSTIEGSTHAVLWDDGVLRDLHTLPPPVYGSAAMSLDERGRAAGVLYREGSSRAFLWSCGAMVDIGTLGDPAALVSLVDMNDHSMIVSNVLASPSAGIRVMLSTPDRG